MSRRTSFRCRSKKDCRQLLTVREAPRRGCGAFTAPEEGT